MHRLKYFIIAIAVALGSFYLSPAIASTITTMLGSDTLTSSRTVINTNFSNLNTDKLELVTYPLTKSGTTISLTGFATTSAQIWSSLNTFTSGILSLASSTFQNITFINGTSSGYIAITGSATNTATRGWNITGGCYAINGTCLGSTLQSKIFVTVGGVGSDYSTTTVSSDEDAINAAIDYVNARGGGTVFVTAGTYTINDPVELKSNVTLRGTGWGSVIKAAASMAANEHLIYFNGQINGEVTSLKLDGNRANQSENLYAWYVINATSSRFTNNYVTDTYSDGLHIRGTGANHSIDNNWIIANGENGIAALNSKDVSITNNVIYGNGLISTGGSNIIVGNSIDSIPSVYTRIVGNQIGTSTQNGIFLGRASSTIITGNNIYSNNYYAIHSETSYAHPNTIITGNTLGGNTLGAIGTITGTYILQNNTGVTNNDYTITGTSTFSQFVANGTATSTATNGINITAGCFSIAGVCVGGAAAGGGGSAGGTWSTTTSTVASRLINYPNNTSDIVAIGSNATTSAEYWFDPNTTTAYLAGNVGVATTSPFTPLAVVGTSSASTFYSFGTATNTARSGFNITSGCFAINGTCVAGGAGSSYTASWPITLTGSDFGFGGLSTSSAPTIGHLPYWSGVNTLSSVATGTISGTNGITVTAGRSAVGGALAIDCTVASGSAAGCLSTTDWTTFNNKVATTRALTIAGTANQITSSAGAQDLSADRTWTLSLPSHVIFPGSFVASLATVTQATTTTLYVSGATSTVIANGINLLAGCFAINGTCVSGAAGAPGASDGGSKWATSSTDVTAIYAALAAKIGVGTTSPYAALSVVGASGVVAERFHATGTTATNIFMGSTGIGSAPGAKLQVSADADFGGVGYNASQLRITGLTDTNKRINIGFSSVDDFGFIQSAIEGSAYSNTSINPHGGNVGVATTVPWTTFAVAGTSSALTLTSNGTATNTASRGWNLSGGCYAINGVCIGQNHALLGNLAWTSSGHTGTANTIPYWNAAGVAAEIATTSLNLLTGGTSILTSTSTLGVGTTTRIFPGYPRATTFTKFGCRASGGGTFAAWIGDGTSSSTPVTSATGLSTTYTAITSNGAFTAGESFMISYSLISGTVADPGCGFERIAH